MILYDAAIIFIHLALLGCFLGYLKDYVNEQIGLERLKQFLQSGKKYFINISLFFILVYLVFNLLSWPLIIFGFLQKGEKILQPGNTEEILGGLNGAGILLTSIYEVIIIYSLAYLVYFNRNAWDSLLMGLRLINKTKLFILIIFTWNSLTFILCEIMGKNFLSEILLGTFEKMVQLVLTVGIFIFYKRTQTRISKSENALGAVSPHLTKRRKESGLAKMLKKR